MPALKAHEQPKRESSWIWWAGWCVVALAWAHQFYFGSSSNWYQIGLGFITGAMLATWAIDITGNKAPGSWRGKSRD